MNIHKNDTNCKLISKILAGIGLEEIPTNFKHDEDFLRKAKWGLLNPANSNNKINYTQSIDGNNIELRLPEVSGYSRLLNIGRGNTLIIGESRIKVMDRSIQFHKIFLNSGFLTRIINFREFAALSFDEQTRPEIHYIVRFNKYDTVDSLPYYFSIYFSNIFVFALNGITAKKYGVQLKIDARVNSIITKFSRENFPIRKHLLASLKSNEFLAINGAHETVIILCDKTLGTRQKN